MVYPAVASAIKPTQVNRVAWVDFAKGIGIFLVVLGHTIRGIFTYNYAENSGVLQWLDTWIYAFHMPLFFFISGLFIQRSAQRGWIEFASRKLGAIVYPYVIWSLIQGILQAFTKPETTPAALGNLWRMIYEPRDHFWFLYALMAITLLFWICERIWPLWLFVGLSVALYIGYIFNVQLALVEPINSWSVFYLLRSEAIYFALGAIVIRQPWFNQGLERSSSQLLAGAAIGLGLLSIGVTLLPMGLDATAPQMTMMRAFDPLLATVGLGSIVLISQAIARSGQATFLETWGKLSLQIYVAHVIFTAILRIVTQKLFKLQDPILFLTLGTAIGIAGPIGLNALANRLTFPYLFNWQPTRSAKP
jgi:fucose 4-O-acetylase-like acetyltransferase